LPFVSDYPIIAALVPLAPVPGTSGRAALEHPSLVKGKITMKAGILIVGFVTIFLMVMIVVFTFMPGGDPLVKIVATGIAATIVTGLLGLITYEPI
jgi:hypothetical protein